MSSASVQGSGMALRADVWSHKTSAILRRLEIAVARSVAQGGIDLFRPQGDETDATASCAGVAYVERGRGVLCVARASVDAGFKVGDEQRQQGVALSVFVAMNRKSLLAQDYSGQRIDE